jgi:hypothetical protein
MLSIRFKLLGFHAVSIICTPVKTLNNYHFCKCRRRRPYEPNCNRRFVFRRPRARLTFRLDDCTGPDADAKAEQEGTSLNANQKYPSRAALSRAPRNFLRRTSC